MAVPVSAKLAATIATRFLPTTSAAAVANAFTTAADATKRHPVTEEQVVAARELSEAVDLSVGLGTTPDADTVKESVRVLQALPDGTDPSPIVIGEYVDAMKAASKVPAPVPATVPVTAPATDEEEDEDDEKTPTHRGWVILIGLILTLGALGLINAQNPQGWQRWASLLTVPIVTVLLLCLDRLRRHTKVSFIGAIILTFVFSTWGVVNAVIPGMNPVDPAAAAKKEDEAKKAAALKKKEEAPIPAGAVSQVEHDAHKGALPGHLKYLSDWLEGPETAPVEAYPKRWAALIEATNTNFGKAIGMTPDHLETYRRLSNLDFSYGAAKAAFELKKAKAFEVENFDPAYTGLPRYTKLQWEDAVTIPADRARIRVQKFDEAVAELKRLETAAAKVKVDADAKAAKDLLREREKAAEAEALKKKDDAALLKTKRVIAQYDLVFKDEVLKKYLGTMTKLGATDERQVWAYSRAGAYMRRPDKLGELLKAETDPYYWDPNRKRPATPADIRKEKLEIAEIYPNREKDFLDKFGEDTGFTSIGELAVAALYLRPEIFILDEQEQKYLKEVTGNSADKLPDWPEPLFSRWNPPVGQLAREIRNNPHPRPEKKDGRVIKGFKGMSRDEWLKHKGV